MYDIHISAPWVNKKPSGAQNRKRKAEREHEQAKQEGSFLKYLSHPCPSNELNAESKVDAECEEARKDVFDEKICTINAESKVDAECEEGRFWWKDLY